MQKVLLVAHTNVGLAFVMVQAAAANS